VIHDEDEILTLGGEVHWTSTRGVVPAVLLIFVVSTVELRFRRLRECRFNLQLFCVSCLVCGGECGGAEDFDVYFASCGCAGGCVLWVRASCSSPFKAVCVG